MFRFVHVRINCHGFKKWALLDSGSQITCVSEEFYQQLTRVIKVSELSASKVYIAMANGKKAATIRKQIFIEINIGDNDKFSYPFMVVPYLSTDVIFGHDWFCTKRRCVKLYNRIF